MKRLIFVFSLMLSSFCIHATNIEKQYDVSFSLGDFVITEENQVLNISTSLEGFALCGDTTKPALPYKVVNILLPYNYEYNGYDLSYTASTLYTNVSLYNTPPKIPTNVSNVSYTPTIASTSINTPILESSEYIYCGYRYVSFLLTPFQYDANDKVLSFVEKINIKVKMKNAGGKALVCNNDVYADVKKMVINNDEIASYGEQAKKNTYTDGDISLNAITYDNIPTEYLIITSSNLKAGFKPLAKWKKKRGVQTEIVTTDSIYSAYSGDTPQLKIKNFLKDRYEQGVRYVLFGGDVDVVPTQTYIVDGGKEAYDHVPCDLYYGCFDKCFGWDSDKNGLYGEKSDSIDLVPEIYCSRLPVNNLSEVKICVDKIISYEKDIPVSSYADKMLLCGWRFDNYTSVRDIHFDLFENYIANIWDGNAYYIDDEGEDFITSDSTDPITGSRLSDVVNDGYHIINASFHGSPVAWGTGKEVIYGINESSSQINNPPSIILSAACYTNAFGLEDKCLSESFLLNESGGALAYLGSSNVGYYIPGCKSAYGNLSERYNKDVLLNLLSSDNDNCHWAKAVALGKMNLVGGTISDDNSYKLQLTLNPLGDAEMPIYTTNPQTFGSAIVKRETNGKLTVDTGEDDCVVTITTDSTWNKYKVFKDVKSISIDSIGSEYEVVISKHNYLPYIVNKFNGIRSTTIPQHWSVKYEDGVIRFIYDNMHGASSDWTITLVDPKSGSTLRTVSGSVGAIMQMDVSDMDSGLYIAIAKMGKETCPIKFSIY